MKLQARIALACLIWVPLLPAAPAVAAGAGAAPDPAPASIVPIPLRIEPGLLFVLADEEFAPGAALTGFALLGPIELGIGGAVETQLFGHSRSGLSAHAGLRARVDRFELDAAGTLGTAYVHENSGSLLSDDPGASGAIAFVGGRAGVTSLVFVSRRQQVRLGVGVVASFEHDLDPYTVEYTYLESGWFSDDYTEHQASRRIGSDRASLRLVFMLGLD